jgi:hypothetical protein
VRLQWTGLRRPPVPADVVAAIAPHGGERLLAWGSDGQGTTVVAGRHGLHVVRPEGGAGGGAGLVQVLDRPWHLVDSGVWNGEDAALRITWVDGHAPTRIVLTEPGMLPETLRERVQASVVLAETVELGGRRQAKVVVRRVLATGELVAQAVLGPGVRMADPGVGPQVRAGLARVREQVGLD